MNVLRGQLEDPLRVHQVGGNSDAQHRPGVCHGERLPRNDHQLSSARQCHVAVAGTDAAHGMRADRGSAQIERVVLVILSRQGRDGLEALSTTSDHPPP